MMTICRTQTNLCDKNITVQTSVKVLTISFYANLKDKNNSVYEQNDEATSHSTTIKHKSVLNKRDSWQLSRKKNHCY